MSEATDGQLQATEQEASVLGSQQAGQPHMNTTDQFSKPELVTEGSKSEQPVKVEQHNPQLQQSQPESQLQQVESNSFQLAEKETGSFGQQKFSGSKVDVAQPSAVQQNAKQVVGQQAPSRAQDTTKWPPIPFHMLIPILHAHLDRDKDMQLQTVWAKLKRNEVHKDDFLRVARNIVGDQMLKQALNEVFPQLQMQAQAQRNKQANLSEHSLFSQVSAQQMPSSGSAQLHEQKVRPPGPPNQGQKNQVSPSPHDFAPLSGTQAQNSPEFQNSPDPEADPPIAPPGGKSPTSASQKKRKLPSVVPFDPTAFEGSLADYNFTQLTMIGATLGYKSALLGEVCVKKAKDQEFELLACRNEVSGLEDLVKSLQRQNNTLEGLVTTTKDQNEKLLTQKKKLRLSRDEAESRAKSLKEKHNDNLEVLEKLWDTIAKDSAEKASLKKQVDQLETKLRDQEVRMKDLEEAMVSYFHEIFTKYTGVLAELGAEAFPYPETDDAESFFTWLEEELDGLSEVVSVVGDNCAMVSIESLLKFLDREGCDIMTRMSEQGFLEGLQS